ncbi:hypothetical protein BKI52_05840 [marine bacterium AO1-C]|nr:hypothetical protein BKI52_05840 [marine bacterium AO1-C]
MKNKHSRYTTLVFTLAILIGWVGTSFSQKTVNEQQIKQVVKQLNDLSIQVNERRRIATLKFSDLESKLKDKKPHSTSNKALAKGLEELTEEFKQLNAWDNFLNKTLKDIAQRHVNGCEYKVSTNFIEQKKALAKCKIELARVKQENQALTEENSQFKLYLLLGLGFNILLATLLYFRKFTRKILWWIRVRT